MRFLRFDPQKVGLVIRFDKADVPSTFLDSSLVPHSARKLGKSIKKGSVFVTDGGAAVISAAEIMCRLGR